MKKLFIITIMTLGVTLSAFAAPAVNGRVLNHFNSAFKNATNVRWETKANFTHGSFEWNNITVDVFYNADDEFLGSSRKIQLSSLPINAQQTLNNDYKKYTATEAFEFDEATGDIYYYVSIKKDNASLILKISTGGDVNVFKKTK